MPTLITATVVTTPISVILISIIPEVFVRVLRDHPQVLSPNDSTGTILLRTISTTWLIMESRLQITVMQMWDSVVPKREDSFQPVAQEVIQVPTVRYSDQVVQIPFLNRVVLRIHQEIQLSIILIPDLLPIPEEVHDQEVPVADHLLPLTQVKEEDNV